MHIGQQIRKVVEERHITVSRFAAEICCTRTHVYKIFNKSNIDIELLTRISRVLNHDFFADLSDEYNTLTAK